MFLLCGLSREVRHNMGILSDFEHCQKVFENEGLELSQEQYKKFCIYADFLVEYNKMVNLTAITDSEGILVKHFLDSVLLLKYTEIPQGARLIDVGTGAGFPSVPLAIMREDLEITLLDSLNKRIVFLEKLTEKLGVEAECIHGRAEDIAKNPLYREKFDVAVARAVANLQILAEYCMPFVKTGGKFIAMKGTGEDLTLAINAVKTLGGEISQDIDYTIPENNARKIAIITKNISTPAKYPRISAKIKSKPL